MNVNILKLKTYCMCHQL